jgi:hypothetical protein
MIRVYRNGVQRDILKHKLQQYLSAGWSQSPEVTAEETIALKPPARVKAAVKSAEDDAIISKGE